ncbi:MAG: peptide deformylase [Deltaproteobacteria bacterium]|nr:peptide deformylase [Deltaproteobacteria bacterium]MBW2445972.1 peptide deformylase [Deltaproteobacteria bacterium]
MALREVLQFPDPRLKQVSEPVSEVTDEIRELARDMCDVMYDEPGIGLAAPQLGESIRLIVVDTEWTEDEEAERDPLVLVNPEIVAREGTLTWSEGCLSVPDYTADIERAARVSLRAHDLDGKPVEIEADEIQAVCFQHEIDHLDGVLFIDHISRLKRSLYVQKRKRALRDEAEASAL